MFYLNSSSNSSSAAESSEAIDWQAVYVVDVILVVSSVASFFTLIYLMIARKMVTNTYLLALVSVADGIADVMWFASIQNNVPVDTCPAVGAIQVFFGEISLAVINCTGVHLLYSLNMKSPPSMIWYLAYTFTIPISTTAASLATQVYSVSPTPNGCYLDVGNPLYYEIIPDLFYAVVNTILLIMIVIKLHQRAAVAGKMSWSTLHLKRIEIRLILMQVFYYIYALGSALQFAVGPAYYASLFLLGTQGLLNSIAILLFEFPRLWSKITGKVFQSSDSSEELRESIPVGFRNSSSASGGLV